MATSSASWYYAVVAAAFLVIRFRISEADHTFSFRNFGKDPDFEADISLYGAAKVVNGGYSIQMRDPGSPGEGWLVYKKSIKLVEGNPRNVASFSTHFSFSISHEKGDSLAFVMAPSGSGHNLFVSRSSPGLGRNQIGEVVSVEFDAYKNVGSWNSIENRLQINVGGFASEKSNSLSSLDSALESEDTLHTWIDYEASYKRLEVRLSRADDKKPVNPLLSYAIDLQKLWNDKEVFMGMSTLSENSSHACHLFSWSFTLRRFPHWLHSHPANPKDLSDREQPSIAKDRTSGLGFLACIGSVLTFATLCVFALQHLWTVLSRRRLMLVAPKECTLRSDGYEYEKVNVIIDDAVKDGKN